MCMDIDSCGNHSGRLGGTKSDARTSVRALAMVT